MNSTLGSVVPLAMFLKTVLKSDLWPGSEKCGFNPKLEDNDLKSGCYRVPKLPPLSVNYVCPISHETNHPIMIPKIVLKSVLWRGSESAWYFCIFPLLCSSLHPTKHALAQPHIFKQPFWVSGDACWCHLVSVSICRCTELSWDNWSRFLRA